MRRICFDPTMGTIMCGITCLTVHLTLPLNIFALFPNLLANLIAEDLHCDFVVGLRLVGRDDHLPGGFVHRDDPLILEKNVDGLGLQRAER